MRTELEILNKLCTIEFQIKMYTKHYIRYTQLIQKSATSLRWKDLFYQRTYKLEEKRDSVQIYLTMLTGMKNELLWVFQRP